MREQFLIIIVAITFTLAGCSEKVTEFEEPGILLENGEVISLYMDKSELEGLLDEGLYFGFDDFWEYEDFYIGYDNDMVTSIEAKTSRIQLQSGMKIGSGFTGDKDGSKVSTEFPGTVIYRHFYMAEGKDTKPVTVKHLSSQDKFRNAERYCLLDVYVDEGSDIVLFIMLKDITNSIEDYLP